jgi:hypothetical protein
LKTRHACPLDNTEWVTQKLGTWVSKTNPGSDYASAEWFGIMQLCCTTGKVDFLLSLTVTNVRTRCNSGMYSVNSSDF